MSLQSATDAKALYPTWYSTMGHVLLYSLRGPLFATLFVTAVQPYYLAMLQTLQLPDTTVFIVGTFLVYTITYGIVNGFFGLCDYYGWLREYKLPRKKNMQPSWELIKSTLLNTALNSMVASPVLLYALYKYVLNMPTQLAPLPSLLQCMAHFTGALWTNEIGFYTVHRTLHEVPYLYRTIHKKHHQYVGTIGIAAEHAHPVEHVCANVLPTFFYCLFVGVPNLIWFTWLAWRLCETYESHSGYCFKHTLLSRMGLLNAYHAEFHDFHHTVNMGNYGTFVGLDCLLGTMDHWLVAESKRRGGDKERSSKGE